jgi:hypothetical protein
MSWMEVSAEPGRVVCGRSAGRRWTRTSGSPLLLVTRVLPSAPRATFMVPRPWCPAVMVARAAPEAVIPQSHRVAGARDGDRPPVGGEGQLVHPDGNVLQGVPDDPGGHLPQLHRTAGADHGVGPPVRAESHRSAVDSAAADGPGTAGGHVPHPHESVEARCGDGPSVRAEGDCLRVGVPGEAAPLAAGGNVPHPYSRHGGGGHGTAVRAEGDPAYRTVGDGDGPELPSGDRIQ